MKLLIICRNCRTSWYVVFDGLSLGRNTIVYHNDLAVRIKFFFLLTLCGCKTSLLHSAHAQWRFLTSLVTPTHFMWYQFWHKSQQTFSSLSVARHERHGRGLSIDFVTDDDVLLDSDVCLEVGRDGFLDTAPFVSKSQIANDVCSAFPTNANQRCANQNVNSLSNK